MFPNLRFRNLFLGTHDVVFESDSEKEDCTTVALSGVRHRTGDT